MAPFLILSLLVFDGLSKLIHPRTTLDLVYLWVVSFQKRDRFFGHIPMVFQPLGCVMDPLSQGRLRLLSGTPQGAMEPLKVATGILPREKASTTEKHFVVILAGTAQFHLGDEPTFALELPSLQTGTDLRVRVFTTSLSAPEVKKFVPSGCYEVT